MAEGKAKTVLVVDDTAFMRILLKDMFEKNGYEVVGEAEDAVSAAKMYKLLSPDLVTMDITMPDIDGIEAVKRIMQLDPKAKIVMVTALGQEQLVLEAIRSGAKEFVIKPFNEAQVIDAMDKIVAS